MDAIATYFQQRLPPRQTSLEVIIGAGIALIAALPFGFRVQPASPGEVLLPFLALSALVIHLVLTARTIWFGLHLARLLLFNRDLLILTGITPMRLILCYANAVLRRMMIYYLIFWILRLGLAYAIADYLLTFGFFETDPLLQLYTYPSVYAPFLYSQLAALPQIFGAAVILLVSLILEMYLLILLSLGITLWIRANLAFRFVGVIVSRGALMFASFILIQWSAAQFIPTWAQFNDATRTLAICQQVSDPVSCFEISPWLWYVTHTANMALVHTIDQGVMNAADLMRPDFRDFDLRRDLRLEVYLYENNYLYRPLLRPLARIMVGTTLGISLFGIAIGGVLFAIRRSILRVP
ncbi:MAG: hypothetical protein MUF87_12135 [Anaerolineae bacterium]|jgi:hypothetical protein|nr:hypothetical protein [Anaerolineae bacterium]